MACLQTQGCELIGQAAAGELMNRLREAFDRGTEEWLLSAARLYFVATQKVVGERLQPV